MKKYNSEACEAIYEEVKAEFEAGLISEAEMREYDELCLAPETSGDNTAKADITHETENIKHSDLVTA